MTINEFIEENNNNYENMLFSSSTHFYISKANKRILNKVIIAK